MVRNLQTIYELINFVDMFISLLIDKVDVFTFIFKLIKYLNSHYRVCPGSGPPTCLFLEQYLQLF